MNIMTKSFGAIVILGALAGCAGDEGTPPPTAATAEPGAEPCRRRAGPAPMKSDNPPRSRATARWSTADGT